MSETDTTFAILARHFWGRFFDTESLSPQGEPAANVTQALGILAVPSAFFVLLFRPLTLVRWELVAVRYMFVSFSMIVMALLMVFEWDALFLDVRDYRILTPLPLRTRTILLAKLAALGAFLGIFLLDINFFAAILWPGIDARPGTLHAIACHVAAVFTAGLFAALAVAALNGVMISLLPVVLYRRVAVVVQTMLVTALITLLVLTPLLAFRVRPFLRGGNVILQWLPSFWFVGFYERLRPAVGDAGLLLLGNTAIRAVAVTLTLFAVTYFARYQRRAQKFLEMPEPSASGPGRFRRAAVRASGLLLVRDPIQRAVFHFMNQTITRSVKHRLFLACYGGLGIALAIMSLASGEVGLLRLPLILSFILVSGLRATFHFPSELRANWIFSLAKSEHPQAYMAAMRKWIVTCAVVPLFALLAPFEFAMFPWSMAVFHLAYGVTLSVLLIDTLFLGFRKIPFTCAYFSGKFNLVGLGVMYILGFTMYSRIMAAFKMLLSRSPGGLAAFFGIACAAHVLLAQLHQRRLSNAAGIDFDDAGDPIIRTLQLSS